MEKPRSDQLDSMTAEQTDILEATQIGASIIPASCDCIFKEKVDDIIGSFIVVAAAQRSISEDERETFEQELQIIRKMKNAEKRSLERLWLIHALALNYAAELDAAKCQSTIHRPEEGRKPLVSPTLSEEGSSSGTDESAIGDTRESEDLFEWEW